jgi:L-asparaginase
MSAALMDGVNNTFSGVINIQYVKNPIRVAADLATEENTVLAGDPATRYARSKGYRSHSPYTEHRWRDHKAGKKGLTGTVGAVAADDHGAVFAATSTGGVGGETPGRVSDSATVAGNYAAPGVAVSCTGCGEEIVNLSVAARIAARRVDGQSLEQAVRNTIKEGCDLGYSFGLIAIDEQGTALVDQTGGKTLFASADKKGITVFD